MELITGFGRLPFNIKLTQLFLVLLSLTSAFAQDNGASQGTNIASIVVGVVLLVVGLIFTFAGNRILKFIIFLAGAILFAYLTFLIANAVVPFSTASSGQKTAIYIAMGVLAFIGGLMASCIWQFGLIVLGGCLGASLGSMLIRLNIISSHSGQTGIIAAFAVVFAIITFIFSNSFVIIATSVFGAYTFMTGVDCFANTGFSNAVSDVSDGANVPLTGAIIAMLVSVLVLAFIGMVVQFKSK